MKKSSWATSFKVRKNKLGYYEITPRPTQKHLESYYSEKYYQEGRGSYEITYDKAELNWIKKKYQFRLKTVEAMLWDRKKRPKKPRMLDVGCGEGFGMKAFVQNGWAVHGIDFSEAGMESKNPQMRPFLSVGDITELLHKQIQSGFKYDCVLLVNVLEHVLEPVKLMNDIKRIVSAEGILLVTVPNDFSPMQKLAHTQGHISSRYWIAPPDHLQYFNVKSLKSIGKCTGWKCKEILGDFPIDWFLFHPGSNYIKDPTQGKLAHRARICIESEILKLNSNVSFNLQKSWANAGMGRDITAIFRLSGRITDKH
jgi:SAM-dependent methyltransferase